MTIEPDDLDNLPRLHHLLQSRYPEPDPSPDPSPDPDQWKAYFPRTAADAWPQEDLRQLACENGWVLCSRPDLGRWPTDIPGWDISPVSDGVNGEPLRQWFAVVFDPPGLNKAIYIHAPDAPSACRYLML